MPRSYERELLAVRLQLDDSRTTEAQREAARTRLQAKVFRVLELGSLDPPLWHWLFRMSRGQLDPDTQEEITLRWCREHPDDLVARQARIESANH